MKNPLSLSAVVALTVGSLLAACQKPSDPATGLDAATPAKQAAPKLATPVPVAKTNDGPFGLAAAMPVAELIRLDFKPVASDASIYTGTAPRPMQGVDEYIVLATPATGVCRIAARVNVPIANGSGDQIRDKVDQLAEVMATKYGKHSVKTDYIGEDVYRRNPQYWMMGLKEDSVLYAYAWEASKTGQALPPEITHIEISAGTSSLDKGWADIRYTFNNFDACVKENQKSKAANL